MELQNLALVEVKTKDPSALPIQVHQSFIIMNVLWFLLLKEIFLIQSVTVEAEDLNINLNITYAKNL